MLFCSQQNHFAPNDASQINRQVLERDNFYCRMDYIVTMLVSRVIANV